MVKRSEKSMELYQFMKRRGFPDEFCEAVTMYLNTDWTAQRMIGYLYNNISPSFESVADEMLAILSERDAIVQKKAGESANIVINSWLNRDREDNN